MGKNRNSAKYNEGYQGEPPDQFIPSRLRGQNTPQNDFYGVGQHSISQASIQIETDSYGYPVNAQTQGGHPVNGPAYQNIVRNSMAPMLPDDEHNGSGVDPSIESIIFKRIISAIFIILDLCLSWMQFGAWVGNFELPTWLSFLEVANSLNRKSPFKAQCKEGSSYLTTTFGVFIALGTAYGCLRIVNMIGETIVEYQKQKQSETEQRCKGFQILHGWVETMLAILCDDLPQVILLVLFSWQCNIDVTAMVKVLVWTLIKALKNNVRNVTCKQKYKPFCEDCCSDCCCVYRFDFICCCRIFLFRPCGCCCQKDHFECKKYDLCPDCTCVRNERCCGGIDEDPKWALNIFDRLQKLYLILVAGIVVISVLKNIGQLDKQQGF